MRVCIRNHSHHLPDALCQQVRALIDLRLPNCALIKERSYLVPSFLLILTLFIWFWCGRSWAQCEGLVRLREFTFLLTHSFFILQQDLRGAAETQRPRHIKTGGGRREGMDKIT